MGPNLLPVPQNPILHWISFIRYLALKLSELPKIAVGCSSIWKRLICYRAKGGKLPVRSLSNILGWGFPRHHLLFFSIQRSSKHHPWEVPPTHTVWVCSIFGMSQKIQLLMFHLFFSTLFCSIKYFYREETICLGKVPTVMGLARSDVVVYLLTAQVD